MDVNPDPRSCQEVISGTDRPPKKVRQRRPPATEPTARQLEVLGFVRQFIERHGTSPTLREIGEHFDFLSKTSQSHLNALERKGLLERRYIAGRSRRVLVLPAAVGQVKP